MRTQSMDTSPEAERVHINLIRKASPAKLFGLVRSLSQTLIEMNRQNLRRLHSEMSEEELALMFVELNYGKELADQVRANLKRRKGE